MAVRRAVVSLNEHQSKKNLLPGSAAPHALLLMNESGGKASAKTRRDLAAKSDGAGHLFVDEVSMIGCEILHNTAVRSPRQRGGPSSRRCEHYLCGRFCAIASN